VDTLVLLFSQNSLKFMSLHMVALRKMRIRQYRKEHLPQKVSTHTDNNVHLFLTQKAHCVDKTSCVTSM